MGSIIYDHPGAAVPYRDPGSKLDPTNEPPCLWFWCTLNLMWVREVTSSPWYGVKIPTLARPTQKGCKAGRGPVGRPPPVCGGRD
ncbi:hypothetical protein AVEN_274532-1 [Araneus ventricosus]|uniref:Uncharacterized protein n=1 Tax=Araneus ventricosus TaxID=182803 RepID=A0A4Y2W012_ARAVE|nr:hypothetical protein AVEN_274532-1 [Araneus ventricosus]